MLNFPKLQGELIFSQINKRLEESDMLKNKYAPNTRETKMI